MRYVAVVSTLTFVLFFAVGPGSIPWMITAELFSQGPRPAAMSLAVLVNWLANFFVGLTFLPLKVKSNQLLSTVFLFPHHFIAISFHFLGIAPKLHILAVQYSFGILLGLHLQDRARNEKQNFRRDIRLVPTQRSSVGCFYSAIFLFQLSFLFYFFLFREEFAAQNCILNSSGPASGTLIVPVSTNTPAHTENTALLAETRTVKTNPS